MDTMEQMKLFLLVILPALQCSTTASMFAASVVIPAVALQLESSFEHAAAMILALKYLFPHQHREYHSPFYHEPRSDDLWNNFMLAHWSDLKFKETFRVDKSSFQWLCQRLSPWLQGGHTNYRTRSHCPLKRKWPLACTGLLERLSRTGSLAKPLVLLVRQHAKYSSSSFLL